MATWRSRTIGGAMMAGMIAATSATAQAASQDGGDAAPPSNWYGWQTLTADAAGIGSFVVTGEPGLLIGEYLVAPPVIHLAHGEIGRAAGSFGLRLGLPALLGGVAYFTLPRCEGSCYLGSLDVVGAMLGAGLGMVGASLIDAFVLANKPAPVEPKPVRVVPSVAVTPAGGTVGLSGTF